MRRLSILLLTLPLLASAPAAFVEHTIAGDLKSGYQVVAADLHRGRHALPHARGSDWGLTGPTFVPRTRPGAGNPPRPC